MVSTDLINLSPNRRAALDMIAHSEGTSNSSATKNNGFDVIVTGADGVREIFTDYSAHPFAHGRPPKIINHSGLESTASGRYQILLRFWLAEARQFGYPSFDPGWQNAYALQQFRERGALALLDDGHFEAFINAISGLWASLPGKAYIGQRQNSLVALSAFYQAAGGSLA